MVPHSKSERSLKTGLQLFALYPIEFKRSMYKLFPELEEVVKQFGPNQEKFIELLLIEASYHDWYDREMAASYAY